MKVTFLGGGSLRLLPILRGIFLKTPEVLKNGEIRLVDLSLERAEAVARMVKACPEYKDIQCNVVVTSDVDAALEGTDVLYLTMAAVREPSNTKSLFIAEEYGYITSDQLSVNGSFLALRIGGFIFSLAKKLEKLSPKALMLIFANPVSVYSYMVNTYTKIRALGICGGFNNHRWDLSRLCGRHEFDPNWNVVAAGVNHCSFILRGDYKGEDLYSSLFPRVLNDSWKCLDCSNASPTPELLENAILDLYNMYRKHNTMIFSTETDGLEHISKVHARAFREAELKRETPFDPEEKERRVRMEKEKSFAEFIELSKHPEQVQWDSKDGKIRPSFGDISIPILKALSGHEKMRIVASRPNYGAVAGMPEMAALEYTMDLIGDEIIPVENQYIPSPYRGLIASLSEFQTLTGDAIAQNDPAIFAQALDAYPVNQFSPKRKEFFTKMFDAYTDLDPMWRKSLDHLF